MAEKLGGWCGDVSTILTCRIVSMLSFGVILAITLGRMKSPTRVWERKVSMGGMSMGMMVIAGHSLRMVTRARTPIIRIRSNLRTF